MPEQKITYRREGKYLYPNLSIPEKEKLTEPLNLYAQMREEYLQEHQKILYTQLIIEGKLNQHLAQVSRESDEMLDRLMKELEKSDPPPDKATNQMGWVRHMNSLKDQAVEVILNEMVYNDQFDS